MRGLLISLGLFFSLYVSSQRPDSFYADSCRYNILKMQADISMSDTSTFLKSDVVLALKANDSLNFVCIELSDLFTVNSVFINDSRVKFISKDNLIIIQQFSYVTYQYFTIRIAYQGYPPQIGYWGGVTNKYDSRFDTRVTWTLSEPFSTFAWLPCKQLLSDKIDTLMMNITVDSHLKAASNGLLKNIKSVDRNKLRYSWESYYPTSYYLVFVAVGQYDEYAFKVSLSDNHHIDSYSGSTISPHNSTDSLLIQNYVYPNALSSCKNEIDKTADVLRLYSQLFGPYPFLKEKYGHVQAPFGGGMEHQTMSLMYYFDFHLLAHELAHQWFGNYVTCSDWQNIFINEGMATYAEYLAHEFLLSKIDAGNWLDEARKRALKNSDGSIYVPSSHQYDDKRIFNYDLSYKKGAYVMHMLRHEINNDPLFFNILRSFLYQYRFGTASIRDFQRAIEGQMGYSFQAFFVQWIYGYGYPEYKISYEQIRDKLIIRSSQKGSSVKTPLFNVTMEYGITDDSGYRIMRLKQEKSKQTYTIPIQGKLKSILIDPENKVLKELKIL